MCQNLGRNREVNVKKPLFDQKMVTFCRGSSTFDQKSVKVVHSSQKSGASFLKKVVHPSSKVVQTALKVAVLYQK